MRCLYREKKIYCGNYLEVYIYPVFKKPNSRNKKARPTDEVQEKLNQKNSENKLIRLMHANFTGDDLEIHLTYPGNGNPINEFESRKDVQNFLRRLKYLRKKLGLPELKYICVTEKSRSGRYHHHVTINGGIDRDELEQLWGKAYANTKRLQFDESGLVGLGKYITKEPIFSKRWNASKNLKQPIEKTNDSRISKNKAKQLFETIENKKEFEKLYPQYKFAEARPFYNDYNKGYYLEIRLYKEKIKEKRLKNAGKNQTANTE